ncbi:MAG: glycosyltransferase family 2 protein [Nibricoccus sp.]
MFSVLLLTLNEEKNLPACLSCLAGCDDIVVIDSGSTDRTVELARAAGAQVLTNRFVDFANQRNFGLEHAQFKHEWVLHLDADEHLTPELFNECVETALRNPPDMDGYFIAPKMIYHGRWIPHCTDFPAFQARFGHIKRFRFVQVGHGQREAPHLRLGHFRHSYLHLLSAQTDREIEQKHRRYAVEEAKAFLQRARTTTHRITELFSVNKLNRRRALKALSQRLPAPGFFRFVYQYILRRGFLDGAAGLRYCVLLARYESWIATEIRRLRRSSQSSQ